MAKTRKLKGGVIDDAKLLQVASTAELLATQLRGIAQMVTTPAAEPTPEMAAPVAPTPTEMAEPTPVAPTPTEMAEPTPVAPEPVTAPAPIATPAESAINSTDNIRYNSSSSTIMYSKLMNMLNNATKYYTKGSTFPTELYNTVLPQIKSAKTDIELSNILRKYNFWLSPSNNAFSIAAPLTGGTKKRKMMRKRMRTKRRKTMKKH
jgi:hypothetical protein